MVNTEEEKIGRKKGRAEEREKKEGEKVRR
jgi:hypothetical protein